MEIQRKNNPAGKHKHQPNRALVLFALWIFSVVLIIGGVLLGISVMTEQFSISKSVKEFISSDQVTKITREEVSDVSIQPVGISIPAISVNAPLVPVGLAPDQTLQVPGDPRQVGWYIYGSLPGEVGPAVMTGHYDWTNGPAIFFKLKNLKPGNQIEVRRSDGSKVTFAVDSIGEYDQNHFPTEEVYGSISHAGLRLITCSGKYDRQAQHYTHNLVVYASLVE